MCDSRRRFTYFSVDCPGSAHDSIAWMMTSMWKQLETQGLPRPFYIVADAAYTGFTRIVCPYSGNNLTVYEDSLNFHVSQVRIEIECAFGM
eukprot:3933184-Rhodomonas_salina.1